MRLFELVGNLFETPLPQGFEPDYFDPPKNEKGLKKYTSKNIIDKLVQHGIKLGKGSSRVAFLLNVEASQFYPDVLKKYDLPTSGMIPTVIKLALNGKGLSQNRAELQHHYDYENTSEGAYLLPIWDSSANIKDIDFDDTKLSHYIQMPVAKKPSKTQFKKWFDLEFGTGVYDIFMNLYNYRTVGELHAKTSNFTHRTEEQVENWDNFITLLEYTGLIPADLVRLANWGVFNGRCYIIDYGFDESTKPLYRWQNKIIATGYVDPNGHIHVVER